MRVAYLGSGDIGLPALKALLNHPGHEVAAVVTQPDRPSGRHQVLAASPIKALALARGVPVLQPERIRRPEAVDWMRSLGADVFVVFAYGQILPPAVLEAPRLACLNLHASLLPRHRGAAPIQASVLEGDRESGLTVMFMDAGLDTGDILSQTPCRLLRRETGGSLHDRLASMAPAAMLDALAALETGNAPRRPQDNALATYAPKLDRQSGRIDWRQDYCAVERRIRAMHPWPGAFTTLPDGASLKIHSALPLRRCSGGPGEVLRAGPRGLLVAAGEPPGGGVLLREVQLEGKRRLPIRDFVRGRPIAPGTMLGTFA
jgi:methionyl-tRNA formyltransferase